MELRVGRRIENNRTKTSYGIPIEGINGTLGRILERSQDETPDPNTRWDPPGGTPNETPDGTPAMRP